MCNFLENLIAHILDFNGISLSLKSTYNQIQESFTESMQICEAHIVMKRSFIFDTCNLSISCLPQ